MCLHLSFLFITTWWKCVKSCLNKQSGVQHVGMSMVCTGVFEISDSFQGKVKI